MGHLCKCMCVRLDIFTLLQRRAGSSGITRSTIHVSPAVSGLSPLGWFLGLVPNTAMSFLSFFFFLS